MMNGSTRVPLFCSRPASFIAQMPVIECGMKFAAVEIIERQLGRPDDPELALELLNRVVGEAARGHFRELATCLGAVGTARPGFEHARRFRRLLEVV